MLTSPKSPRNRRLSEPDRQRLRVDLANGVSTAKLAEQFGVSRRAIQQFGARINRDPGTRVDSKIIAVRLRTDEISALDTFAAEHNIQRPALLRRVLRRASGFFDADESLQKSVGELARELRRIGTNLNQLVSHANRKALVVGKGEISADDLEKIITLREEVGVIDGKLKAQANSDATPAMGGSAIDARREALDGGPVSAGCAKTEELLGLALSVPWLVSDNFKKVRNDRDGIESCHFANRGFAKACLMGAAVRTPHREWLPRLRFP